MQSKIYVVTGQTATGKTNYAIELAKKHNGELINCDSRQLYKYLNIITGKDLLQNTNFSLIKKSPIGDIGFYTLGNNIPIWLYDILNPKQSSTIHDYRKLALEVIKDVVARGKTPVIVGGTYLYIHHLLYNVIDHNIEPNWKLRNELKDTSVDELQKILALHNNKILEQLNQSDRNNPHRLIRKIEIAQSGLDHTVEFEFTLAEDIKKFEVTLDGFAYQDKDALRTAITNRVIKRLKNGAIEEVTGLLKRGYINTDPGLNTIGYIQVIDYLKNISRQEDLVHEWVTKEMQYAKRQLTFMKKNPYIKWTLI